MKVDIGNVKLARRDFLKLTSASAVGGTLIGASATLQPLPRFGLTAHAATTPAPRVAVGYWDGQLASSFIDATEADPAPGRIATSARISVATGCDPDEIATWDDYRASGLTFDLRPFHDGALRAWRHQAYPVAGTSPLAQFDVPLDAAAGLRGWIDYRSRTGAATVPFRIGAGGSLRSGTYLFMLSRPGSLTRLDWSTFSLRTIDGGEALELRDDRGRAITQPHVVVEVLVG